MSLVLPPLSRRALWARAYAQRRLGWEGLSSLASLHYALEGERRGFRPNGFFDPEAYRRGAGLGSNASGFMERYLSDFDVGGPAPSREFDAAWYASHNPEWRRTHPHPFLHFLEVGLASGKRPRADIDMTFVRDVIRARGDGMEEAALRVFDPKPRDGDMKPPLSREELKARQDRFYAEGSPRIERWAQATSRRWLVFVQSGPGFDASYLAEPRDYDVLLNLYQEGPASPLAEIVTIQAGTKTTAIRRLLETRPDLLLRYDAVLFLDDDVEITPLEIDALFAAAEKERLDCAGPALTADSESAWPFLKKPRAGNGVLRVSSVEIMAPLLSSRALARAGWAFSETVSGWGTDLLLGPAVRAAFGPESVGVVGSVAVRHARPVDTAGGALYALLRRYGIDPAHEANRVAADYGVDRRLRLLRPEETGPTCVRPS